MYKWYMVPQTTPHIDDPVLIAVRGYDLPMIARFYWNRFVFWHRGKEMCEYLYDNTVKYWMPLLDTPEVEKSKGEAITNKWNKIPQSFPENGDIVLLALNNSFFPKIAEFRDDMGKAHFIFWNAEKEIIEFADSGNVSDWIPLPDIPKCDN